MDFKNSYEDITRAESYSRLEFPNTYYLAFRDLPEIILKHTKGRKAIDFGCGTGRSTRLLQKYGFEVTGIDISGDMIKKAREMDPRGNYLLIKDANFDQFNKNEYDLILSAFTFDNIPGREHRITLLKGLGSLLNTEGKIILLDSTWELYRNEWASFSTRNFPENRLATSGQKVRVHMKDVEDKRPVEDIIWNHEDYLWTFYKAGLKLVETYKPLGKQDENINWISETRIAPWVIYLLRKGSEEN